MTMVVDGRTRGSRELVWGRHSVRSRWKCTENFVKRNDVVMMKRMKICAFCGAEFVPNCGTQRYCCEECAAKAKQQRKVRQRDFLRAATPLMDIQSAEYLSFSKAALLMGCSRQYVYKLVAAGKLAASRISNRMSFVRRADIEAMLAANPYHRVLVGA